MKLLELTLVGNGQEIPDGKMFLHLPRHVPFSMVKYEGKDWTALDLAPCTSNPPYRVRETPEVILEQMESLSLELDV